MDKGLVVKNTAYSMWVADINGKEHGFTWAEAETETKNVFFVENDKIFHN